MNPASCKCGMAILRDMIISIAIAIFIVSAVDLVIWVLTQAPVPEVLEPAE
jgi:hypothetical protein